MDDVVDKPTLAYLLRSAFESKRIRSAGWWLRPPMCKMYDYIDTHDPFSSDNGSADSEVFEWYVDLIWEAFSREYYR